MTKNKSFTVLENKGMSEKELLALCSNDDVIGYKQDCHNWTSEVYGIGKHLREYAYYPASFPLLVHSDHGGPYQRDTVMPLDLKTHSPVALFHSPRYVNEFRKHSDKKSFVLYSPFVFYRRKRKIEQSKTPKGTLAFVAHSTPDIDDTSDMVAYINDLKSLPLQYHPVSVMIHYHDANKGVHKIFLDNDIPIYTAGNPHDYRFVERFYDIMKNFKYTTSNSPMSCLFYSVEMGIPHFLYGNKPHFINKSDENVRIGKYDAEKEYAQTKKLVNLFTGIHSSISQEQKDFVEYELGLYDGMSRLKCALVLYSTLAKFLLASKDPENVIQWSKFNK